VFCHIITQSFGTDIKYIYYWIWQFLTNVIIIKTKVLLPQAYVTSSDFGYPVYALSFIAPEHF
jgi:hypothetical protein